MNMIFTASAIFQVMRKRSKIWKALLPEELVKYHAMRLKAEAQLKADGFSIDTTYQDSPFSDQNPRLPPRNELDSY
jgi:hypothetical protein